MSNIMKSSQVPVMDFEPGSSLKLQSVHMEVPLWYQPLLLMGHQAGQAKEAEIGVLWTP